MFQLSTTGFGEMISELEQALAWLEGSGISTETKRHATYLRTLRLIDQRWRESGDMPASEVPVDSKLMETAVVEASQLIEIRRAFGDSPLDGLAAKLKILSGGPVLERDEKSGGHTARDHGFELEVAAYFRRAGVIDLMRGVDVVGQLQAMPLFIECKRPSSSRMIARNLDRASDQIMVELDATRLACYGIPAISVAKVDWRGGVVIHGKNMPQVRRTLRSWIARVDEDYVRPWFPKQRDGRIMAVLVHIPYVAYVGDSPTMSGVEIALIGSRFLGARAQHDLALLTRLLGAPG